MYKLYDIEGVAECISAFLRYIVLEYANRGDLHSELQSFGEKNTQRRVT